MKIVLFSDLHAHPLKPYASILTDGMNSRLADAANCIDQVYEYAVKISADVVLFGGDMFHVRGTLRTVAFNVVYEKMAKFVIAKIPVALIPGNHDQADKAGEVHSVYALRSYLHVLDSPGWHTIPVGSDQLQVLAVPYTEDLIQLKDIVNIPAPHKSGAKLFLGHLGIQGATVGADFVYSNPHDPTLTDLNPSGFDAGFLGHYHEHQALGPHWWYIGAPLQHTWGDKGQWRGFLVYDTDTRTIERIPLKAPKFVEIIDWNTVTEEMVEDNYVRLVTAKAMSDDDREAWRVKLKARSFEVIPPKVQKSIVNVRASHIALEPNMTMNEVLREFIDSGIADINGLDDNYLLQLGAELLAEAEEN